jgi:hypothetical protein
MNLLNKIRELLRKTTLGAASADQDLDAGSDWGWDDWGEPWCRHGELEEQCGYCTWTFRKVIMLCGSMRFFDLMLHVAAEGAIVLAPFAVMAPEQQTGGARELKARLDQLHLHKIGLADLVVVVSDASGYWGASTATKIAYARAGGIPVHFRQIDASAPR